MLASLSVGMHRLDILSIKTIGLLIPSFALVVALLCSCNETTSIGADLIDDSEYFNSLQADTFQLLVNTIPHGPVETAPVVKIFSDGSADVREYMLGTLNDPVFGYSTSELALQVRLSNNDIDLGEEASLDSVVLSLRYANLPELYGETETPIDIEVFELEDDIVASLSYDSDQTFAYSASPLGTKPAMTFSKDSIYLERYVQKEDGTDSLATDTLPPIMRIRLDDELGERLIAASGTEDLASNANFFEFFKGLYLKTNTDANSIATFDVRSIYSRMTLYYNRPGEKGLTLDFPVTRDDNVAVISHFEIDHTGSEVEAVLNQDSPNGNELVYLQPMGGLGFSFEIPSLKDLGNVIINRARLDFTVIPESDDVYESPSILRFNARAFEDSTLTRTVEFFKNSSDTVNNTSQYSLPMTFFLQDKLEGRLDDREQVIFVNTPEQVPNRLIIGGPGHPDYPMKLEILYTPIED